MLANCAEALDMRLNFGNFNSSGTKSALFNVNDNEKVHISPRKTSRVKDLDNLIHLGMIEYMDVFNHKIFKNNSYFSSKNNISVSVFDNSLVNLNAITNKPKILTDNIITNVFKYSRNYRSCMKFGEDSEKMGKLSDGFLVHMRNVIGAEAIGLDPIEVESIVHVLNQQDYIT